MRIERMVAALVVVGALLVGAAPASAQLGIGDVVRIVEAVHDAEGVDLGVRSTRDSRNEFFARAIGIVAFGHPKYNPTPDPRWCIKDGGNGRPQSDDVAVLCSTRESWDLIGGAGAAGYKFHTDAIGVLPAIQNVYAPPRPKDWAPVSGTPSQPPAGGGVTPAPTDVRLIGVLEALARLEAKVDTLAAVAVSARDAADAGRAAAQSAAHDARELNAFRLSPEFSAVFSWLASVSGRECLEGPVPKAFGGSTRVRFCLVPAGQ